MPARSRCRLLAPLRGRGESLIAMRGFGPLALVAAAAACGPSYQAIYEGDSKFEHCYALDESPNRAMQEKAGCWREWEERYTYGQTRDRIQYATGRFSALSRVPDLPTDEAMMQAAPGETPGKRSVHAAPVPTNAFAPPPSTLTPEGAKTASPAPQRPSSALSQAIPDSAPLKLPPPPTPPGADCRDRCASDWQGCKDNPTACEKTYRKCMHVCFK